MSSEGYHKIHTIFKRSQETNQLIFGDWSYPEFEYLSANEWEYSEKLDGTNIRVTICPRNGCTEHALMLGGRTNNASIPQGIVKFYQENLQPRAEELFKQFEGGATLFFEGIGPKIQKVGAQYGGEQRMVLIDVNVWDDERVRGGWWLNYENRVGIANHYGLEYAPVVGTGNLIDLIEFVETGANLSIYSTEAKPFEAEGIIARPLVEMKTRAGNRIITKLKKVDFSNGMFINP